MGGIVEDIWEKSNSFGSIGSQKDWRLEIGAKNFLKSFHTVPRIIHADIVKKYIIMMISKKV